MEASLRVACAILEDSGRVLIARRKAGMSNQGLWEFPGGKVESGENDIACLIREFREEFGLEIAIGDFFMKSDFPSGNASLWAYFAKPSGPFGFLLDHDSLVFEYPAGLGVYEFSPADIPLALALEKRSGQ